jgi:hypothetical protein
MGAAASAASTYSSMQMGMDTDMELDYQQQLLRQLEVARAAGQQQTLAQVVSVGGLNGGGGAGGGPMPWGAGRMWMGVSDFSRSLAVIMVPLFVALAIGTYLLRLGVPVMFASVFIAVFFMLMWIQYHTVMGYMYVTSSRPFITSFTGALIVAGVVAFIVYAPYYNAAVK